MTERDESWTWSPLPVCWERQTQAVRENKEGRGRQNKYGRRGMFMCFLFGSNEGSLTAAGSKPLMTDVTLTTRQETNSSQLTSPLLLADQVDISWRSGRF